MREASKVRDTMVTRSRSRRGDDDVSRLTGYGVLTLRGPDGSVKRQIEFTNLITDVGDQVYAEAGAGEAPDLATGMRLGTGNTAPAKNGAGAAIVTYVSGSAQEFDATFPSTSNKGAGAGHRISYRVTWDPGDATANGIEEVVITNEDPLDDVAGSAADTLSRALLDPPVNKAAEDTLEVEWHHDFQGA